MRNRLLIVGGAMSSILLAVPASAHGIGRINMHVVQRQGAIVPVAGTELGGMISPDDGSGYGGQGTATGGPAGGLPNRN